MAGFGCPPRQFQTGYVLGQLAKAGVRIFTYLTGQEAQLGDATGKFMLAVGTFADEMEREKARQRTRDGLAKKARDGYVVGGRLFGYDNIRADGRTTRRINTDEAAVVQRIYTMVSEGTGLRAIAHALNADHVTAPRPSKSGPRGWSSGTIRAIVERTVYKGVVTWNKTAKQTPTGVKRSGLRKPSADWIVVPAPDLRIVSDEIWQAAADRLAATRSTYLRTIEAVECRDGKTRRGLLLGRPRFGNDAKYLLIGLAECAVCGGGLQVRGLFNGGTKVLYYECTTRRQRGLSVCSNRLQVRMDHADRAVLSLVETQVFGAGVVRRVMQHLAARLASTGTKATTERAGLEAAAKKLERQQQHLVTAIADGDSSRSVRAKLAEVEQQQTAVADRLRRLSALVSLQGRDLAQLEAAAWAAVTRDWAGLLARHPLQARTIVKKFVQGRFRFEPQGHAYKITATASTALIVGAVVPALLPPSRGHEPGRWWPQGDSNPCLSCVALSPTLAATYAWWAHAKSAESQTCCRLRP